MKRFAAAFLMLSLGCPPAFASGTVECASADENARLSLTIGSLPVLAVVGAKIDAGGKSLGLNREGDEAVAVGQAFATDNETRIDFTDPNVERVVAEIRLFSATEGRDMATAGTLKIPGAGAWALVCSGP